MYRVLDADNFTLSALLAPEPPLEAILAETTDQRWAGRRAREICLGTHALPVGEGLRERVARVLVRGSDGSVFQYDASRGQGSRYKVNGLPRNMRRQLCPNYPACQNAESPWMFPPSKAKLASRKQEVVPVCDACRKVSPSDRHRSTCRKLNEAGRRPKAIPRQ